MVDVIKLGNGVIQELNDLERIAKQAKDRRNNGLVIVTVALGDTTDNIVEAQYFGNGRKAQQIFGIYETLIRQIGDKNLETFFTKLRREFDTNLVIARQSRNLYEQQLASGDRLTAHMLHAYFRNSGVDSMLVDTDDPYFPLIIKENRKSTTIDMEGSREVAQGLKSKNRTIIVPGYVGRSDGLVRTLGRGGGDTAAFVYAYAFKASSVWIVAEDALTTAPIDNARLVDEIDLDEAWAAGFFGARLRTYRSVEPLGIFFENNHNSLVYVTGKDMTSRRTRINPNAKEQTVRFIASRHIERYGVKGDTRGLYNTLYGIQADWFIFGGMPGELGIGSSERGRELVEDMINRAKGRGEVEITYHNNVAYLGVVGSGMRETKGVAKRAYSSLKGVNILRTYDPRVSEPNSSSIGIMVDSKDERRAVEALHREFFLR